MAVRRAGAEPAMAAMLLTPGAREAPAGAAEVADMTMGQAVVLAEVGVVEANGPGRA